MLIVAIIASALLVAGGLSLYFSRMFRQQEMENRQVSLDRYAEQLESDMEAIRRAVINIVTQNGTFDEMQYLADYDKRVMAKMDLMECMRTYLTQYPLVECVFAYSSYSGDFLFDDQQTLDYPDRLQLRGDIRSWIAEDSENYFGKWHTHVSMDRQYLVYLYHNDTTYAGCVIPITDVLSGAISQNPEAYAALLAEDVVDSVGNVENLSRDELDLHASGYIAKGGWTLYVTVAPLGRTDYTVATLMPSDSHMSSPMYASLWIIALFLIVVVPAILAVSTFSFTRPVRTLVGVMEQVGGGDLDARVPMDDLSSLKEFRQIGASYNRSLDRISALTMENLEKQKAYQRAQLNALQMQVDPHFLMNSLNIIYAASCGKKNRIVQEMCLHLSGYYRYSMSSNRDLVPLAEEVRFTQDYLKIMKLRFEDSFSYEISLPPFLKNVLVPPMILKTFAGNSVKYAVKPQRGAGLDIWAELLSEGQNTRLKLVIEDTGPGYPQEMLGRQEEIFRYDTSRHTGIRNVYDRIRLLFGEEAELRLENRKGGGAYTQILLPVRMEEEYVSGFTGG